METRTCGLWLLCRKIKCETVCKQTPPIDMPPAQASVEISDSDDIILCKQTVDKKKVAAHTCLGFGVILALIGAAAYTTTATGNSTLTLTDGVVTYCFPPGQRSAYRERCGANAGACVGYMCCNLNDENRSSVVSSNTRDNRCTSTTHSKHECEPPANRYCVG